MSGEGQRAPAGSEEPGLPFLGRLWDQARQAAATPGPVAAPVAAYNACVSTELSKGGLAAGTATLRCKHLLLEEALANLAKSPAAAPKPKPAAKLNLAHTWAGYAVKSEGMGFVYLMQNFQSERLIACASATNGTSLALDRSVNGWGRERTVFGKPLMKHQVWQHKFVDLYTKVEAARSLTYRAGHSFNEDRYVQKGAISFETTKLIAMAKIFVGDVASEVADQVVQFHGGMGYLEDLWVARYFRDQRLLRIGGGTSEVMKHYVARILGF